MASVVDVPREAAAAAAAPAVPAAVSGTKRRRHDGSADGAAGAAPAPPRRMKRKTAAAAVTSSPAVSAPAPAPAAAAAAAAIAVDAIVIDDEPARADCPLCLESGDSEFLVQLHAGSDRHACCRDCLRTYLQHVLSGVVSPATAVCPLCNCGGGDSGGAGGDAPTTTSSSSSSSSSRSSSSSGSTRAVLLALEALPAAVWAGDAAAAARARLLIEAARWRAQGCTVAACPSCGAFLSTVQPLPPSKFSSSAETVQRARDRFAAAKAAHGHARHVVDDAVARESSALAEFQRVEEASRGEVAAACHFVGLAREMTKLAEAAARVETGLLDAVDVCALSADSGNHCACTRSGHEVSLRPHVRAHGGSGAATAAALQDATPTERIMRARLADHRECITALVRDIRATCTDAAENANAAWKNTAAERDACAKAAAPLAAARRHLAAARDAMKHAEKDCAAAESALREHEARRVPREQLLAYVRCGSCRNVFCAHCAAPSARYERHDHKHRCLQPSGVRALAFAHEGSGGGSGGGGGGAAASVAAAAAATNPAAAAAAAGDVVALATDLCDDLAICVCGAVLERISGCTHLTHEGCAKGQRASDGGVLSTICARCGSRIGVPGGHDCSAEARADARVRIITALGGAASKSSVEARLRDAPPRLSDGEHREALGACVDTVVLQAGRT